MPSLSHEHCTSCNCFYSCETRAPGLLKLAVYLLYCRIVYIVNGQLVHLLLLKIDDDKCASHALVYGPLQRQTINFRDSKPSSVSVRSHTLVRLRGTLCPATSVMSRRQTVLERLLFV